MNLMNLALCSPFRANSREITQLSKQRLTTHSAVSCSTHREKNGFNSPEVLNLGKIFKKRKKRKTEKTRRLSSVDIKTLVMFLQQM